MKKTTALPCPHCGELRACEKKGAPNHILHIILSIITLGWWLIVYALIGLISYTNGWICTVCRKKVA